MIRARLSFSISMLLLLYSAGAPVLSQQGVSCGACHAEEAAQYAASIHAQAQIDCRQCHGGALVYPAGDGAVKGQQFDHGEDFRGKPTRFEIPETCATCHSDVERMNPYGLPANQLKRYRTSGHGRAVFEENNDQAAVCTDCHDTHAIFKSSDPRSRTNPLNVPDTCGRCHSDEALMSAYGQSTAIVDEYRSSVHGRGLLEDNDSAMPTCATCHGNHAATPPGVESVHTVCARCHPQANQYFLKSPHAQLDSFRGCVACHGGEEGHDIRRVTSRPARLIASYMRDHAGLDTEKLIEVLHPGLPLIFESCYECHDEDSDDAGDVAAFKMSADLFDMIGLAEIEYARVSSQVDEVGRGILLVEDEQLLMADARTAILELGSVQHSFDLDEVKSVAQRVHGTAEQVVASIDEKEANLAWRYIVLVPMWIFIVVFALASYEKYRRLKAFYVKPLK